MIAKNPMVTERNQIPLQFMMDAPTPVRNATYAINLPTVQVIEPMKTKELSSWHMDSFLINRT